MKNLILLIGVTACSIFPPLAPRVFSHGATGETRRALVGENFAVIAFDPQKGFQLGAGAKTRMNLKVKTLSSTASQQIPVAAIVQVRGATEVFRIRDAWVSRVPVTVLERKGEGATVQGSELKEGDGIVIRGAPLLRVTELDLSTGLQGKHSEDEAADDYYKYPQLKPVHDHGAEKHHDHQEPKGHFHGDGEVHHHD